MCDIVHFEVTSLITARFTTLNQFFDFIVDFHYISSEILSRDWKSTEIKQIVVIFVITSISYNGNISYVSYNTR